MSRFEEIGLQWGEKEYKIAPNRVMGLIESIESIVTLEEINAMMSSRTIKRAQLARAYRAALSYAGANVQTEEVYEAFFGDKMIEATTSIMVGLLAMMIPPEHLRSKQNPKPKAAPPKAAAKKSSRKPTKRV